MEKARKVYLSVTNDLSTDQRVHKVCSSLTQSNYEVVLIGRQFGGSKKLKARAYKTKRFALLFNKGPLFYANYNFALFFYLLMKPSGIYLANDLDSLPANFLIAKLKRKALVYDSHEYFTEVPELINRPKIQRIWKAIEKRMLPKIKYAYTVSERIAAAYAKKYGIQMEVIRNFPVFKEISTVEKKKNTILYQGALNVGRGLEELIDAMKYLENVELWLVGEGDIIEELKLRSAFNKVDGQVIFLGQVPFEELRTITQKASLGVSLEKKQGLNYEYAVPNKVFDYIHAEVPVLYADLVELVDLLEEVEVGEQLKSYEPRKMAEQIHSMLYADQYLQWVGNCQKVAQRYSWEREEQKLISIFKAIE